MSAHDARAEQLHQVAAEVATALPGVHGEGYAPGNGFPVFVMPTDERLATDADAVVAWFGANLSTIDRLLTAAGALVLRGFAIDSTEVFDRIAEHYPEPRFGYTAGGSPRASIAGSRRAYEATRAPSRLKLPQHQEMSYLPEYPDRIAFYCNVAPPVGGETTIADMRRFSARLDPALLDEVFEKGIKYIRRFRPDEWRSGNDDVDTVCFRPWTEAFGAADRAHVEEKCREMGLETEWHDDGFLTTYYVTAGARRHPETGEVVWFNQVTAQSLRPETRGEDGYRAIKEAVGDKPWPLDQTLGDGTRISDEDLKQLYALYDELEVCFPWRERDLMLIDNYVASHGRNPYEGTRDIQVALLGRA